jgi:hypothetical protein
VYRKPRPFWEGERSLELFSKALETDRHLLPIDWRRAQPFRSTADAGKTARGTGATLLKRQAKCITELLLSHLKRISLRAHPAICVILYSSRHVGCFSSRLSARARELTPNLWEARRQGRGMVCTMTITSLRIRVL